MSAWAAFYPWVLTKVRGAPQPLIDQALRDAAREFCLRSRAWEVKSASVPSDGTTRSRSFVFPAGAELVRVERASVGGEPWEILNSDATPDDVDEAAQQETYTDTLVVTSKTTYQLWPIPASGEAIVLHLSLRPTIAATLVGDVIFEEYGSQMAQGAVALLKAMTGRDWFDADGAVIADAQFEAGVHAAANRKFSQNRRLRTRKTPI